MKRHPTPEQLAKFKADWERSTYLRWDTRDAEETIVEHERHRAAVEAAELAGPCPHCGAPAEVDMLDVSSMSKRAYVPGQVRCSARCWERNPEGYITAVRDRRNTPT